MEGRRPLTTDLAFLLRDFCGWYFVNAVLQHFVPLAQLLFLQREEKLQHKMHKYMYL